MEKRKILAFDGSYYCHRSYNRAIEWISQDAYKTEDCWMDAVVSKSLEITLQSVAIALERYNAVGAIMPLDMDTSYFINNLKSFNVESAQDTKYKIINRVRQHLMMHLPNFGIVTCGLAGIEADDFGYLISRLGPSGLASLLGIDGDDFVIHMMTKDKDWYQCIEEDCIWVSGENFKEIDVNQMREWYGENFRLTYVAEQCCTRTKDGNKGIVGVGWKGASKIMSSLYDPSTKIPYPAPLGEWKMMKEFKKVVDQYDQFLANWMNIDCEWITYMLYPGDDKTVRYVMYQHIVQASNLMQVRSQPSMNQVAWMQLAAACGEDAKLRSAMHRISEYVQRSSLHRANGVANG